MTQLRRRRRSSISETTIIGGTQEHAQAVRDESSHGIKDIRLMLVNYPQGGEDDFASMLAGDDSGSSRGNVLESHGHGNYPSGPDEFVDPNYQYPDGVIESVKSFKAKKTFNKPLAERLEAMKVMITELSGIYAVQVPEIVADSRAMDPAHRNDRGTSGTSNYSPAEHKITMNGKLSIITLLHEFGHAMGGDEPAACAFSFNLFAKVWPDLAANMNFTGHMATR